jgi:hypothetical protein
VGGVEGLQDRVADHAVVAAVVGDVDGEEGLQKPDAPAGASRAFDRRQRLADRRALSGAQAQGDAAGVA